MAAWCGAPRFAGTWPACRAAVAVRGESLQLALAGNVLWVAGRTLRRELAVALPGLGNLHGGESDELPDLRDEPTGLVVAVIDISRDLVVPKPPPAQRLLGGGDLVRQTAEASPGRSYLEWEEIVGQVPALGGDGLQLLDDLLHL